MILRKRGTAQGRAGEVHVPWHRKAAIVPEPSLPRPSHGATAHGSDDDTRRKDGSAGELREDLGRAGSIDPPRLLDAALRLVTSLASGTVRGADGVSITLERHGQMATVAASDDTIRRMDIHQYDTGEGPCLSAAAEGRWLHSESLADEKRWPRFVSRAIDEGIASILSTPLLVSTVSVGALNMYSRTGWAFGPVERDVALLFASNAADLLGEVVELDEDQGVRIAAALTSRDIIAMAQGVHMSRLGVSAEEAAGELYRAARRKGITVRAEAVAILDSTRAGDEGPEERRG